MTMNLGMYNNSGGIYSGEYAMGYNVGNSEDSHQSQYHGYEEQSSVGDHYAVGRSGAPQGRAYNAGFYAVEGYQEYQDLCQRECQKIPHEENFYHLNHTHQAESLNIITANGLSYTDLDYSGGGYQKPEPGYERLQYSQKHHEDLLQQEHLHHHPEEGFLHHNHSHGYHQLPPSMTDTGQHFHGQESQHFPGVKEEVLGHSHHEMALGEFDQRHLNHRPSPQQAVPTYKWMQVKRNMPKPQGESKARLKFNLSNPITGIQNLSETQNYYQLFNMSKE